MKKSIIILSVIAAWFFLAVSMTSCCGVRRVEVPDAHDVVMYQINPRVFAANNSLQAVTQRLDSISDLGVNVLWFMPLYEIGQVKTVNSPYCIKDYKSLNPEFGTFTDFDKLVREAHRRGMSVIIDWVANHTSWDSEWIQKHPEWYTQDSLGVIISPAGTGWNDVADLNFDNMEMNEFVQNFAEQFDETDASVFAPETKFRELDEWSSFLALGIMAMIKSEYDVAITADEMRNANTIQELYDTVKQHL